MTWKEAPIRGLSGDVDVFPTKACGKAESEVLGGVVGAEVIDAVSNL
jgi:hypothetical protein